MMFFPRPIGGLFPLAFWLVQIVMEEEAEDKEAMGAEEAEEKQASGMLKAEEK